MQISITIRTGKKIYDTACGVTIRPLGLLGEDQ